MNAAVSLQLSIFYAQLRSGGRTLALMLKLTADS